MFMRNLYIFFILINFWVIFCEENGVKNTTAEVNNTLRHAKSHRGHSTRNATKSKAISLRMVTECLTPNGDFGYCMPLRNCTKLLNQLKNENAQMFREESKCGSKNDKRLNPRVCCGKYDNYKKIRVAKQKDPFPKTCGKNIQVKSRILGGKEASLGEFPWMARLIHKKKKPKRTTFGCGGFLITAKFVLTAAHCLESKNIKTLGPIFEVELGEHNTDTKIDCDAKNTTCADIPQVIRVKKCIVHPNYNMSSIHHHNDIGLIHLKKAAQLTDYVSPICVMKNFDFDPFEYWISGWGTTDNGDRATSPIKMKLSLPPYSRSNCTEKYKIVNVKVIDNQICAGGKKNHDSCSGDSGGPLMVVKSKNWFAVGIVSFGLGCGINGWPGVYTNVTSYLPWIEETILKQVIAPNN